MKKRLQITVGPKTQKLVKSLAARYRKETSMEWSDVDILESAAHRGLSVMASKQAIPVEPLTSLRA